jgi:hypothetical protein
MSGSGSDTSATAGSAAPAAPEEAAFVERDDQRTELPFDKGGVPFYIALLWAAFIVAYVVAMSLLALPDLRAWLKH